MLQTTVDLPIVQSTDPQTIPNIFPDHGMMVLFTVVSVMEASAGSAPTIEIDGFGDLEPLEIDEKISYASSDVIFLTSTDLTYRFGSDDLVGGEVALSVFGCIPNEELSDAVTKGITSFGESYFREEDLSATFSSIPFSTTPTEKVVLTEDFTEGKYIVFVSYRFGMDKVSRAFVSDVTLDGNTLDGQHIETMFFATNQAPTARTFEVILDEGSHTFKLRFGIDSAVATAELADASITVWRVR